MNFPDFRQNAALQAHFAKEAKLKGELKQAQADFEAVTKKLDTFKAKFKDGLPDAVELEALRLVGNVTDAEAKQLATLMGQAAALESRVKSLQRAVEIASADFDNLWKAAREETSHLVNRDIIRPAIKELVDSISAASRGINRLRELSEAMEGEGLSSMVSFLHNDLNKFDFAVREYRDQIAKRL